MTGPWRARRGGYQQHGPRHTYHQKPIVSSVPAPPLGQLLESLNTSDLAKDAKVHHDQANIQDCSLVTSYNWLDQSDPTMVLPGKPPRWTPLPGENKLAEDSEAPYRDKNGARYPSHLMDSTVLAALSTMPALPADLDVVACYSSLGNLVRFVLGAEKTFRVLVQVVDNTVFFVRRENSPTEKLEGIRGHGHTFPQAYTSWDNDVKDSDTCHRILKYTFGGLRMLVRAEADAYLPDPEHDAAQQSPSRAAEKSATRPNVDDLTAQLSTLNQTSRNPSPSSKPITILKNPGLPIPQSRVLEIKTRGIWKKGKEDTANEEMPKLWLAQIPNFVVAYHQQGVFSSANIEVQDVQPLVQQWEKKHEPELAALAALVHKVIAVVRGREDGRVELCRDGMKPLEVREVGGEVGDVLSEGTMGRWREGCKGLGKSGKKDAKCEDKGAELEVEDGAWDEGQDWTHCSADCGYCGRCKE